MCTVYGVVSIKIQRENSQFLREMYEQSLSRGAEFSSLEGFATMSVIGHHKPSSLYIPPTILCHHRTPTNDSKDQYPIRFGDSYFAMNGIISSKFYSKLVDELGDIEYTVDSAYMFKKLIDSDMNWSNFDTTEAVFAGWMYIESLRKLILFNKDYPLFVELNSDCIRFSSFKYNENFKPLGNSVLHIDVDTFSTCSSIYNFKKLVYEI